jgi:hypothetical protein
MWRFHVEKAMFETMAVGDVSSTESEAGGFRVAISATLLSVSAWGYWSPEVAAAFSREAAAFSQKLRPVAAFMLDAAEMKPQGTEGQEALRSMFRAVAAMSVAKVTLVANNVFTKMQIVRLLRECGLDGRLVE